MYSERTNGFDAKIIAENKRIPLLGLKHGGGQIHRFGNAG